MGWEGSTDNLEFAVTELCNTLTFWVKRGNSEAFSELDLTAALAKRAPFLNMITAMTYPATTRLVEAAT